MSPYAENPETGERLVLQGESWVPVQKAINPTTGETLELFNDQWVAPALKTQASTSVVMGAPAEGLPGAPPPDGAIPPQAETMWQGVKRLYASAIQQDPIQRSVSAGMGQVATELGPGSVETAGKLVRAAGQMGSALYQGDIARAQAMAPSSEYDPLKVAESMKPAERAISTEGKKVQAAGERGRKTMEAALPQNAEGARYVGGIVGKFAQLAALSAATGPFSGVVAPVTLGSEAGVNAYDKAVAEGYSDTKARQVAMAQGGLNTLLMAVGVPGVKPAQGATEAFLKALFLKAPALAGVQAVGDKTIDKMILDKKTTLSETVDTFLEHYKNFAAFEALGAVQQVPRLLGTRDAYVELGKKYASADDAKVSLTMEAMRALQGEATPESVARLDSARSTLAAIEQAEKAGRKIKWTGKIETMEVSNAPETRTQQEGNQPEYRGGYQVSQGDGQIREPARLPEEVAPVDQSSGVPVSERPQEAQAKAEEAVVPRGKAEAIGERVAEEGKWIESNPVEFNKLYDQHPDTANGKILSWDAAADIMPSVKEDPVFGHGWAQDSGSPQRAVMRRFNERMAEPPATPDEAVMIMVGNAGAGKTTLAKRNASEYNTVLDATGSDARGLIEDINSVLRSGRKVDIMLVHAPLEQVVARNVKRQGEQGRPVPIENQATLEASTVGSFLGAWRTFGDPAYANEVGFALFENRDNKAERNHFEREAAAKEAERISKENRETILLDRATNAYIDTLRSGDGNPSPEARSVFEQGISDRIRKDDAGGAEGIGQDLARHGRGGPGVLEQPTPPVSPAPARDAKAIDQSQKFDTAQTLKDEFRDWFKKSKIVDDNGGPSVWFHGTTAKFDRLEAGGSKIYLTQDPKFAASFAATTGRVIPVYVKSDKPFDYQNRSDIAAYAKHLRETDSDTGSRYDRIRAARKGDWQEFRSEDFVEFLNKNGYDSHFEQEEGFRNLAVFDGRQVRVAQPVSTESADIVPSAPAQAVAPRPPRDTASAIFGGTQVPAVDLEAVRGSVREAFPGKDEVSKAIRHALYKRKGFLKSNPTPEEILAAGEQIRGNPLLRRRKEAGAVDFSGVDTALDGIVKKLVPDRTAVDPPLTQEQVIQKARDAEKHRRPIVNLSKVNTTDEGIDGMLAYWDVRSQGASVREDGVPTIGGNLFPSQTVPIPARDLSRLEQIMSKFDPIAPPSAVLEGGIWALSDPLFKPGTCVVADAAFGNMRGALLKEGLLEWHKVASSAIPDHRSEVQKAIKPIMEPYLRKRDVQAGLEKQLGRRLEIRALERERSDLDVKLRKANQEQTRDITPPPGVEGGPAAETRANRQASRAKNIMEIEQKIAGIDEKIVKIRKDKKGMPVLDNPSQVMAKYELLETQLGRSRAALEAKTAELGAKFGDVRVIVAAKLGARPEAYPEWLTASIRPHEQRVAEIQRKFYDESALPAMEAEGIPGRPGENFVHQPIGELVKSIGGDFSALYDVTKPSKYTEEPMDPSAIKFHHKEDNALLWYPSMHASMESYINNFSSILSKRELANRWDKAITEMRANGQMRLAKDTENFLNTHLHGSGRNSFLDFLTSVFYWKNLALNPSPAVLHAVKGSLNYSEFGVAATTKGQADVARQLLPGESNQLRRNVGKAWMGAKGGVAAVEQGAGVNAPFRKGKLMQAVKAVGAAPIGQVELVDRNVTLMSALRMAKAQGMTNEQAFQAAMGSTLAINFLGVDRQSMYRGSVGEAVFAFMGAPTKLAAVTRRRAQDVLREFVKAAKAVREGEVPKGFSPRGGKPWLPEKGPGGESWRKMQSAATYAITYALLGYLGDELLHTKRFQQGLIHLPKVLKLAKALATGDTADIYGSTADIAPFITQAMDNIDKYGLGVGMFQTVIPTEMNKVWRGSPSRKTQPQWGGSDKERFLRYQFGTPNSDIQERVGRRAAFKKAMQQKRNRETWRREHSWLGKKIKKAVD